MTVREKVEPVYDINEWIAADPDWRALVTGLGQNDPNIFYPAQQDPKSGFPWVRYTSRVNVAANTHWMHNVQVTYAMYFDSMGDSAHAMNIIMDKVRLGDVSAGNLNRWIREDSDHDPLFEFKTVQWISGGHTEAAGERGGAHARLIAFTADYTPLVGTLIS